MRSRKKVKNTLRQMKMKNNDPRSMAQAKEALQNLEQ